MESKKPDPGRSERLLRLAVVSEITGLKKTTIYKLLKQGSFPPRYALGLGAVRWKSSEIEAWIASLPRA